MSWMEKLYQTYENCANLPQFENNPLTPVSHATQQAHIEIVLDGEGNFLRAEVIGKEPTLIPMTEKSAGRAGGPAAHPLCDKIRYCAADYISAEGKKTVHPLYLEQLRQWVAVEPNPKVAAVLRYVERGTLVDDLTREKVLHRGEDDVLLVEWNSKSAPPAIFKVLPANGAKRDQGDALVRWRVQIPEDPESAVWKDSAVQNAWIRFDAAQGEATGLCVITGEQLPLAINHPKRLRHGGDGAKLISSNDSLGYTYRGRFLLPLEACGIGSVVTQKAHTALRWLIARQGYHDKASGQVVVSWATGGQKIPELLADTSQSFRANPFEKTAREQPTPIYGGDAGQNFGLRLRNLMSGYANVLSDRDDIIVLGLDSATPGRMAITYYRELTGSEFLDRIYRWHSETAWLQNFGKDRHFIGVPAPRDIAEAAYGRRVDDKLRKATVERLLPCIVDGRLLPRDLVDSSVRRATQRTGLEPWEWEKCLGIACALFRGSRREEHYAMSLEENRRSRDYLFGRLLAIAENIESLALYIAKEARDTTATRLMQRFADHPASTWRTIELALVPYMSRLQTNRPAVSYKRKRLLDDIIQSFQNGDFTNNNRLSGEFLLGYHCQRAAFFSKTEANAEQPDNQEIKDAGENQ
jgi:CRISPR-associated protein Csd1